VVRPALRSRSRRKVTVRTPGSRNVVHYETRFASKPRCAICGRALSGLDETRVKTKREPLDAPSRPYGGYVCHNCLRTGLRISVRMST